MSILDSLPPVPVEELSLMQRVKRLGADAKAKWLARLSADDIEGLPYRDDMWMRRKQLALLNTTASNTIGMGGRGWGKTRILSATVKRHLRTPGVKRGAVLARTEAEFHQMIMEGDSGILATFPPDYLPKYNSKKRILKWPDGKECIVCYGDKPDQTRGINVQFAVIDEGAKYHDLQLTWRLLLASLRVKHPLYGDRQPPALFTTTPEPHPTLNAFVQRAIDGELDEEGRRSVLVVTGATYENVELPRGFIRELVTEYGVGTRIYQQEILGKLLMDIPGALWDAESFNRRWEPPQDLGAGGNAAVDSMVERMGRVVVAVDPSGARGKHDVNRDQIGISVVGLLADQPGQAVVMADETLRASGDEWPFLVAQVYRRYRADCVVAENNFGGDLVRAVIHTADPNIPYVEVRASRGKVKRAQPVAALYNAGRVQHVHHVSPTTGAQALKMLEAQMQAMTSQAPPLDYQGDGSPDRADAAVWALTHLFDLDDQVQATWDVPGRRASARRKRDMDLL